MIQCLRWRWGVVQLAAQRPLEPLILVRVQAPQLFLSEMQFIDHPEDHGYTPKRARTPICFLLVIRLTDGKYL